MKDRSNKNIVTKEKNGKSEKPAVDILTVFFMVLVVFIVILVGVVIVLKVRDNANSSLDSLGILVGASALVISSSLIIPRAMLKSEVANYLENARKEEFDKFLAEQEEKFVTQYNEKVANVFSDKGSSFVTRDEFFKVDAHLSRMVAFSLQGQAPVWAIGWAFRALKRYIRVPEPNLNTYQDFISLIKVIVKDCRDKVIKAITDNEPPLKMPYSESFSSFIKENSPVKGDEIQHIVRAIKDILDFSFFLNTTKMDIRRFKIHEDFGVYNSLLQLLTLVVNLPVPVYNEDGYTAEKLFAAVCKISDYGKDEKEKEEKDQVFTNSIHQYFVYCCKTLKEEEDAYIEDVLTQEQSGRKFYKNPF